MEESANWVVYIAQSKTGYYYTGVSIDAQNRIRKHNMGKGARFARMHGELQMVYVSETMTKSEALKRELQIKGWVRAKKQRLIFGEWT